MNNIYCLFTKSGDDKHGEITETVMSTEDVIKFVKQEKLNDSEFCIIKGVGLQVIKEWKEDYNLKKIKQK